MSDKLEANIPATDACADGHELLTESSTNGHSSAERAGEGRISAQKLLANQRNALKGGVKSEEGKCRSKRNSWKHGGRARTLLIENDGSEQYGQFRKVLDALQQEYKPSTIADHVRVEQVAIAILRERNVYRFELAELRDQTAFHDPAMDRLLRYHTANRRDISIAMAALEQRHKRDQQGPTEK